MERVLKISESKLGGDSFAEVKQGTGRYNIITLRMYEIYNIWQGCFANLEKHKLFTIDIIPERIVFYFIFMPLIRYEINEFVLTWNAHRIRAQNGRSNSVAGIPDRLYFRPQTGIENMGRVPDQGEMERQAGKFANFGTSFPLIVSDIHRSFKWNSFMTLFVT